MAGRSFSEAGGSEEWGVEDWIIGVEVSVSRLSGRPAKASGAESFEKSVSKVE